MGWFNRNSVSVQEAAERAESGAVLIDVRTKAEWRDGYAHGAQHISLDSLPKRFAKLNGHEVYVICRSGNRSGRAAKFLRNQGINATNVRGGMLAWQRAGLAVAGNRTRGRR